MTHLSRLMANVGDSTANNRRLLMVVMESILLYGCKIWADAVKMEIYRRQMSLVQRRGALRVESSHQTVPDSVVLVIAGVVPIDLLAKE